jgi:hypothetical protein
VKPKGVAKMIKKSNKMVSIEAATTLLHKNDETQQTAARARVDMLRKALINLMETDTPQFELIDAYVKMWRDEVKHSGGSLGLFDFDMANDGSQASRNKSKDKATNWALNGVIDPLSVILANPKSVLELFPHPEAQDKLIDAMRKEVAHRLVRMNRDLNLFNYVYNENDTLRGDKLEIAAKNLQRKVADADLEQASASAARDLLTVGSEIKDLKSTGVTKDKRKK